MWSGALGLFPAWVLGKLGCILGGGTVGLRATLPGKSLGALPGVCPGQGASPGPRFHGRWMVTSVPRGASFGGGGSGWEHRDPKRDGRTPSTHLFPGPSCF